MAKMDERLPLTEGTNRVIADPAMPSAVGAAFDFATQALGGYVNLRTEMAKEKAKKKAEEDKATEAQIAYDVSGANDRAAAAVAQSNSQFLESIEPKQVPVEQTPSLVNPDMNITMGQSNIDDAGVFTPATIEMPSAIREEVSVAAQRAANFKAAQEQGRIPSITFNSAMNADFRRLRDKYPEHVEKIIDMYKKMGVDANLFTEAKDAVDEHTFQRELNQTRISEQEKRNEDYIKLAVEAYGPVAATWSREQQVVEGMRAANSAYELRVTGEEIRINQMRTEISEKDKKSTQEELNQRFAAGLSKGVFDASQPFVKMMGELVDGLNSNPNDPDLIQRFQNLSTELNMGVERYVTIGIQAARESGFTGDYGQLEKEIRQAWKPVLDIFAGDHSVVAAKMDALKSIQTSLKIDTATALPLYTSLQAAGFDVAKIPAIMQGLETDTDMMKALAGEMKGFRQDLLSDGGSTRLRRIIGILRGETSLAYAAPGQLAKELPTLVETTRSLAKNYVRNPDSVDPNHLINGIGEVTTQIRTLGPSNSMNTLYVATRSFAGSDVRQALIKSLNDGNVDLEMARATVQASRAGSAQLLNYYRVNLGNINRTSNLFKVVWDDKDGKYKLDSSGQKRAIAAARRNANKLGRDKFDRLGGSLAEGNFRNAQPPEAMTRFIQGANVNLENAIELGKYDASTPQATEVQLRNWYGMERPLPVKSQDQINPEKELDKMFDKAEEAVDRFRQDVTGRSAAEAPEDYTASAGFKQHGSLVKAAATTHGVPEQIAIALIGKESKFNPGAKGPVIKSGTHKGDRAMGLGQVMAKTAAKYGITNRASLSPAEQADLSMRILADNYKETGNWKDAVSMYFTGVRYSQALREGRTDGFTSVLDYVEGIL